MNILSYISNYFYSQEDENKCDTTAKFYKIDSSLLLWDLEHMNYSDLENKYRCKYITICNILRKEGFSIYTKLNNEKNKLITVPIQF